ncbi:MAG: xanthine dehydrogenase family protein molybdopterin-binding subunit [Nitrospirae bacterium]|nr:xanthine dehydrogenase family protein molybdopterin-binding subunit [Nitrospirota bacterium]
MSTSITRRTFIKIAGLTIAVVSTPSGFDILSGAEAAEEMTKGVNPNVWIKITQDNHVVVTVNKSEMGQGIYTALPMIIADELEADWKQVKFEVAPAADQYKDPVWGSQATGGSSSIRHMYEPLRKAGAAAREMLVTAAASNWKVPAAECEASQGLVKHLPSNRTATYGELSLKAAAVDLPKEPKLKKESQFRYIGTSLPRLDILEKTDGTAKFGIDTIVPDMLYATVSRPYNYGAKVVVVHDAAAHKLKGLQKIFQIDRGVAFCADTLEAAWQAKKSTHIVWGQGTEPAMTNESLEKAFETSLVKDGIIARKDGDAQKTFAKAPQKLDLKYSLPYLSHATMEPMNCTAHVQKERCDIWAPTQNQTGVLMTAQKITGLKPEQIHVHTTYLGGGFGRRFEQDFVEEAVQISKEVGRPVKVIWTREEDMQNDYFRPGNLSHIQAALDEKGNVAAWSHKIVCPSIFARVFPGMMKNGIDNAAVEGLSNMEYEIPNLSVEYVRIDTPVPVGFWRSVGSSHNAFTVESVIDELAHLAKKDPLKFRLGLLGKHPRAQRVLQVAAEKAGWGKPLKKGIGRGIAYHLSFDSYVAQVADIAVNSKDGTIQVKKVVCAVDCGSVVNPDTIKAQMMGGIVMGLSSALKEKIEFARGKAVTENFDTYPLLTMSETPEIEVHIVTSNDKLGGIGEPGVPPVAPAVANALFNATGVRMRSLPMTPEAVVQALKGKKT